MSQKLSTPYLLSKSPKSLNPSSSTKNSYIHTKSWSQRLETTNSAYNKLNPMGSQSQLKNKSLLNISQLNLELSPKLNNKNIEKAYNYILLRDIGCSRGQALTYTKKQSPRIFNDLPKRFRSEYNRNLSLKKYHPYEFINNDQKFEAVSDYLYTLIKKREVENYIEKQNKFKNKKIEQFEREKHTFSSFSVVGTPKVIKFKVSDLSNAKNVNLFENDYLKTSKSIQHSNRSYSQDFINSGVINFCEDSVKDNEFDKDKSIIELKAQDEEDNLINELKPQIEADKPISNLKPQQFIFNFNNNPKSGTLTKVKSKSKIFSGKTTMLKGIQSKKSIFSSRRATTQKEKNLVIENSSKYKDFTPKVSEKIKVQPSFGH